MSVGYLLQSTLGKNLNDTLTQSKIETILLCTMEAATHARGHMYGLIRGKLRCFGVSRGRCLSCELYMSVCFVESKVHCG